MTKPKCPYCDDLAEKFKADPPEGEQASNAWEYYELTGHFPVHTPLPKKEGTNDSTE